MIGEKFKTKLKTGDLVKIISGKNSGKIDHISKIKPKLGKVYFKSVFVKKYSKFLSKGKKESKIKEIMVPIDISNVSYFLEKEKTVTKIGFARDQKGKKKRFSRKHKFAIN